MKWAKEHFRQRGQHLQASKVKRACCLLQPASVEDHVRGGGSHHSPGPRKRRLSSERRDQGSQKELEDEGPGGRVKEYGLHPEWLGNAGWV